MAREDLRAAEVSAIGNVVLEAPNDYAADCFRQYGLKTNSSGRYTVMYKPYHLIGLELNISILSAALRQEPTGQPHGFRGDVASVAKRNLRAGEMLDGEGGCTVWGKLMLRQRRALPQVRCRLAWRTG